MLIFLDLDGTIIGPNGMTPAVGAAIDAARRAGFLLSVCTGRPRGGVAQSIARRLGEGPHIFENGAMVAPADGAPQAVERLTKADALRLARHSKTAQAVLEFYTPEGVFVSRNNADCQEHAQVLEIVAHEADLEAIATTHDVMRAHWIMRPENSAEALLLELDDVEVGLASSPVLLGYLFASVTRVGVSKGTAAARVAEFHGRSLVDCWAVGDAEGDRPVLDVVGHPRVMGNSPSSLLADFMSIGDVEDDAVAELLNSLVAHAEPAR